MDEELREAVYEIVRLVPPGRVTNYGAIARAVGLPTGARQVGRAMGMCPAAKPGQKGYTPAHRVVAAGGVLSAAGAFGGYDALATLLEAEGVKVRSGRIVGWKKVFWDPMQEI